MGASPGDGALQTSRDQNLHDLVGAGINAHYRGVPVHARYRIFRHIAIAAEQLQATVDYFSLRVGDPVFRHRGSDRVELARDVLADAMVEKDFGERRFGLAFRQDELRVLKLETFLPHTCRSLT